MLLTKNSTTVEVIGIAMRRARRAQLDVTRVVAQCEMEYEIICDLCVLRFREAVEAYCCQVRGTELGFRRVDKLDLRTDIHIESAYYERNHPMVQVVVGEVTRTLRKRNEMVKLLHHA